MTAISNSAFYNCTSLENITIPDSVESIETAAFSGSKLRSIDIPGSVETIGSYAFNGLTTLTSVTLNDGLKTISDGAFVTSGVAAVTIPKTVTSIGQNAFAGCGGLSSVTILGAATNVGNNVFAGCSGLHKVTSLIETGSINASAFSPSSLTDGIYGFAGTTTQTYATTYSVPFHTLQKVVFESKGGSDVPLGYTAAGGTVDEPDMPTLSGKAFAGWYDNEEYTGAPVTFPYTVSTDKTLFAKWVDLTLSSSDSDGTIYTGGRVTLTPSLGGGTWDFDEAYLSRDGNTFTALKAGKTTVTYAAGGISVAYDVTIEASGLPTTGQDFA